MALEGIGKMKREEPGKASEPGRQEGWRAEREVISPNAGKASESPAQPSKAPEMPGPARGRDLGL